MDLRPYQEAAIEQIRAAFEAHRRVLYTLPTGGGKSAVACRLVALAVARGRRVLVIAHRKELLDQMYAHLSYHEHITAGLMRADDERTDPARPVQLASIASLARRDLPAADIVIVDEAHRCPGESYTRVVDAYPDAHVLGLTATPCRLDGRPLAGHFEALLAGPSYSELIGGGYLAEPAVYAPAAPDLSRVAVAHGDYVPSELESAMRGAHVVGDIVETWTQRAKDRSTVVFAPSVEYSKYLCGLFASAGVKAQSVDGAMSEAERASVLLALELGDIQVVTNVSVLTEGWDQPRVKCCIDAAPTISLGRYMQKVGRILRPYNGIRPILLDHAGNVFRHGLPHEDRAFSLSGSAPRPTTAGGRICAKCFGYSASATCGLCGFVSRAAGKPREVRTASGELSAVERAISRPAVTPSRAYFDTLVSTARSNGYKPGYAKMKFKERFGYWPTWSVNIDDSWREAMARRQRERGEDAS